MTEVRPLKCSECAHGWHGECERSVEAESYDGGEEPDIGPLCCCAGMGLWFDADGNEHYPDGAMYEPVPEDKK